MTAPHSIEKTPPRPANDAAPTMRAGDVTKAARYTLISMHKQSIGRLAMQYKHVGTDEPQYIAYAIEKRCVYGHRFALMDRFSQAFVMAHETFHHVLGHIPMGAVLYKRDPKRFSFKVWNIACDAVINHVCAHLPDPDKGGATIRYGVRRCQELGIVNWEEVQRQMRAMAKRDGAAVDPVFDMEIATLNSQRIYHAMMGAVRRRAEQARNEKRERSWADLLDAIVALVAKAVADHAVVYRAMPLELGAIDLHDALADVVRTYRSSAAPADRADATPVPRDDWNALVGEVEDLVQIAHGNAAHKFTEQPVRRGAALWNDLVRVRNAFSPPKEDEGQGDGEPGGSGEGGSDEETIIDRLADELNAHDDLREAIEKASEAASEGELLDQFHRSEDTLRRVQAGAGSGDAIMQLARPDGTTKTRWDRALRRFLNSALIRRVKIDPTRQSRRTVAAGFEAFQRMKAGSRAEVVQHLPRISRNAPAKRCVIVWDTSGSVFGDRKLLEKFMRETATTCKRVDAVLTVIMADAAVAEVISIGEAYDLIKNLKPKGGGATDFRPAIAKAMEFKPDCIIYLTDLMGTFPEKAPKTPVVWAYPTEFANQPTPWGHRLELVE